MGIIEPIVNGEARDSVRTKLETLIRAKLGANAFAAANPATYGDVTTLLNTGAPTEAQIVEREKGSSVRAKLNGWHNDLARVLMRLDLSTVLADDTVRIFGPDGVTAVSAPGTAVSLAADDWQGLVLGAELSPDVSFSSAAGWSLQAGWAVTGGQAVATGVASFASLSRSVPEMVTGKTYLIEVDVASVASGNLDVIIGTNGSGVAISRLFTTAGVSRYLGFLLPGQQSNITMRGGPTFTGAINSLSVREILNWPAYQNTAAARPQWGRAPAQVRNLLMASEAFENVVWEKSGVVVTPNAEFAPDGTLTADLVVEDTSNGQHRIALNQTGINTFLTSSSSVYVKRAAGTRFIQFQLQAQSFATRWTFDLEMGVAQRTFGGWGTDPVPTITNVGNGWYRIGLPNGTNNSTGPHHFLLLFASNYAGNNSYIGDGASGFYIWGAQAEQSATISAYQRRGPIPTDITETGVRSFGVLSFDGSDDALLYQIANGGPVAVAVFGRGGSFLIPSVTLSANTLLSIGPLSALGNGVRLAGCPEGILRAVGTVPWSSRFEIVGVALLNANPTAEEQGWLMEYFAGFGARGWLVEGPELVTNGEFASGVTGWVEGFGAGQSTFVSSGGKGVMTVTAAGPSPARWVTTLSDLTIGRPLILRCGEFTGSGGTGDRFIGMTDQPLGIGTGGGGFDAFSLHTQPRIVVPTVSTMYLWVGFNLAVSTCAITVDNISVRALTPEF